MEKFKTEIMHLPTADLLLIVNDQADLYSEEELNIIWNELNFREEDRLAQEATWGHHVRQKEAQQAHDTQKINSLVSAHLVTTGYNFEGYEIKEYLGIVSGETVLGTGFWAELCAASSDLMGDESYAFSGKLSKAKKLSLDKMIHTSAVHGGNAIIGVDFDYVTFPSNMIGVVANGTSVKIQKITR